MQHAIWTILAFESKTGSHLNMNRQISSKVLGLAGIAAGRQRYRHWVSHSRIAIAHLERLEVEMWAMRELIYYLCIICYLNTIISASHRLSYDWWLTIVDYVRRITCKFIYLRCIQCSITMVATIVVNTINFHVPQYSLERTTNAVTLCENSRERSTKARPLVYCWRPWLLVK